VSNGPEVVSWTVDQYAAAIVAGKLIDSIDEAMVGMSAITESGIDVNRELPGLAAAHCSFVLSAGDGSVYDKEADVWRFFGRVRPQPFGARLERLRDPAYTAYRRLIAAFAGKVSLRLNGEREDYLLYTVPNDSEDTLGIVVASAPMKIISEFTVGPVTAKEQLDVPRWRIGQTPWDSSRHYPTRWIVDYRGTAELADTMQYFIRHGERAG